MQAQQVLRLDPDENLLVEDGVIIHDAKNSEKELQEWVQKILQLMLLQM